MKNDTNSAGRQPARPPTSPDAKDLRAGFQPDVLEHDVLKRWEAEQTLEESLRRRSGSKRYSFYDGPPYATGAPHYGHVLQSVLKDAVTRYWTMRGYRVDRRVGWDCHGLPVENLVEKELGIKNKREIEAMGIEKFNAACRAAVFRSVDEFQTVLKRIGRWADYTNAYATLDPAYMESVWWVFKQVWDAGYVYKGFRSSPYCPRCATPLSNFETAQGYKDVDDPAITVKFPVTDAESTSFLVWTTTPWTLPGNAAVAVHPDLRYVKVKVGDEHWILAKDRLSAVVDTDFTLEEEYAGAQLAGMTYEPLYDFVAPDKAAYRVVPGTFVSATEGTGIVHMAPAFGEDDLKTAQTEDLPILKTVDENGRIVDAVTPWAGLFVKDADPKIIKDLADRNLLLREERYRHAYPFCWRCDTPLIYYATDSWYVAVSRVRDQLLKNNEQIRWVPEHLKHGRFAQGLQEAPDWAISRSRFWGTPIPVWICEQCGEMHVMGSIEDLKNAGADLAPLSPNGPDTPPDLHRPYIDQVTMACRKCGGSAKRVPEVFDVWMDSGSMPYAQWHYPFENKDLVEETFPADFVGESLEMTRGWFYTLHVLATILTLNDIGLGTHQPAFRNVTASGLILAEDGRKFSKKYKNYTPVDDVVKKFGADTLRLYLLASTTIGEDYRISERLLEGFYRKSVLLLLNVLSFYETYADDRQSRTESRMPDAESRSLLDRWVLARVAALARDIHRGMESYHLDTAAKGIVPFIDDLSNWYVRRSRRRFASENAQDCAAARATLKETLQTFALVTAPLIPFLSDELYRRMGGTRSPHLEDFPVRKDIDEDLLHTMGRLREIISAGLKKRAEKGIKVRQPLAEARLVGFQDLNALGTEGLDLARDELNVKTVAVKDAGEALPRGWEAVEARGGTLFLNTELTPELADEGVVRDLIRHTQELRKRAGLTVRDTINLAVASDDARISAALDRHKDTILKETRARALASDLSSPDATEDVTVSGAPVRIRIRRA